MITHHRWHCSPAQSVLLSHDRYFSMARVLRVIRLFISVCVAGFDEQILESVASIIDLVCHSFEFGPPSMHPF